MSVFETDHVSRVQGAWRAPGTVLRLEKTSGSAASNGERRDARERRSLKPSRRASSCFETAGSPLAAYAAQVIGQALDAHEKPSAPTAYRERPAQAVPRFDRSV